jgi:hypothetical protein
MSPARLKRICSDNALDSTGLRIDVVETTGITGSAGAAFDFELPSIHRAAKYFGSAIFAAEKNASLTANISAYLRQYHDLL